MGGVVAADLRLIEATALECDEAVLTGESQAAAKSTAPAAATDSAVDLPSCAFMGTVVCQGSGRGVIVATGGATAFGKIALGLGERQTQTAFQAGLQRLLQAAGQGRRRTDRRDPGGQHRVQPAADRSGAVQPCDRDRHHAAVASGDRVGEPLHRFARARAQARARQAARDDRGPRQPRRAVLRQDGHAHRGGDHVRRRARSRRRIRDTAARARVCSATRRRRRPAASSVATRSIAPSGRLAEAPALQAASRHRRLGLLPFDHERQLVSVVVRDAGGDATLVTKGAPEAVHGPVRAGPRRRGRGPAAAVRGRRPRRRRRQPPRARPRRADDRR